MRIEILVDHEQSQIFPLKKSKILLGSHESCDVVLEAQGISRKHLMITEENDSFFVTDQGSTNGSYINEERLVPGKRIPFTTFFPVRLGDNVLITLLGEEDIGLSSPNLSLNGNKNDQERYREETRKISLKDLEGSKTDELIKVRESRILKKMEKMKKDASQKKEGSSSFFVQFFAILIFVGAAYYNLWYQKPVDEASVAPPEVVSQPSVKPITAPPVFKLVDASDLVSHERLMNLRNELKCATDVEKPLCEIFFGANSPGWGVVQIGTMLNILVDGEGFMKKARDIHKMPLKPTQEILINYEKDLEFLALLHYINSFDPSLQLEKVKDLKITLALFYEGINKEKKIISAAFIPESYIQLKKVLTPIMMKSLDTHVSKGSHLKNYFRLY